MTVSAGPAGKSEVVRPAGLLRIAKAVGRRWPTLVAVAWAAISLYDLGDGLEYAILFVLPATGYLFLAVVDRPRITWGVVFGSLGIVTVLRLLDIDPWPALAVVVVTLIAVGLLGGQLRRPGLYTLQTPGALAFFTFGLIVLSVPNEVGGYLVGLGLLAHAAWDATHLRAGLIVSRSFAEWCGVLDLIVGLGIMIMLLAR